MSVSNANNAVSVSNVVSDAGIAEATNDADGNVVELTAGPGDDIDDDGEYGIRDLLVDMLALVDAGRLTSFVGAGSLIDGTVAVFETEIDGKQALPVVGALKILNDQLSARIAYPADHAES